MPMYCFLDVLETTHLEEMKGDRYGGCMKVEPLTFVTALMGGDVKPFPLKGDAKQFSPKDKRKTLATLLVQLEETEEQIDNLQQLRSDLLKEIASAQQGLLKG
jgi:hypothetical protein